MSVTAAAGPIEEAADSTNADPDRGAFPVAPIAGAATAFSAAGAWWLVAAKRAARTAPAAHWGIPHGGVRPPQ
ncbi:MAG: hypothetical protein OEM81_12385 [Acidimicrobiia bacterium]|nr:hypothetical protein [Acidimicrobiia bacterium]